MIGVGDVPLEQLFFVVNVCKQLLCVDQMQVDVRKVLQNCVGKRDELLESLVFVVVVLKAQLFMDAEQLEQQELVFYNRHTAGLFHKIVHTQYLGHKKGLSAFFHKLVQKQSRTSVGEHNDAFIRLITRIL